MEHQFSRIEGLFPNYHLLKNKTVCIVGLGGVGGHALISLVRSGVHKLIICDFDKINITNINRQVVSNLNNINKYKTEEFLKIIHSINKECQVITLTEKFDENSLLFNYQFDFLIDCIDEVKNKCLLIEECLKRNIPFISSMGMAYKVDPTKVIITKLSKTTYDPLARTIRKKIKKDFYVVSSTEEPIKSEERFSYINVVACAGILLSDFVIKKLIQGEEDA